MKVLFVCGGKKDGKPGNVVLNQASSLVKNGIDVTIFTIKGSGFIGYIKSIFPLLKEIKKQNPDIVHAHYSLSGFIAVLSTSKPVIVSLMGSEMHSPIIIRWLIHLFYRYLWRVVIVKTNEMKQRLKLKEAIVLPNGVDTDKFLPIDKIFAREKLGLSSNEKIVLFLADPKRPEKNFKLAKESVSLLNENVNLLVANEINPESVPWYLNAADVVLLTSLWEGSPNIIKEAMACNAKIVSVDVGDVKQNFYDVTGCFLAKFDPNDIAFKLSLALNLQSKSTGRNRIFELGLDDKSVASNLLNLYHKVLN